MVEIGEADIAADIAPQDATDPAHDVAFLNGETTRIRMVMKPPLDDLRVRKALNLAFDREALVDEARAAGVPVDQELRLVGRIGFYPNEPEVLQSHAADVGGGRAERQGRDDGIGRVAETGQQALCRGPGRHADPGDARQQLG
ncbi:MAG: hypothetical protein H7317_12080 [Pseudorhodobacter sp.]|nr:hypothetical protein [Pseudorhodobacter sp.]